MKILKGLAILSLLLGACGDDGGGGGGTPDARMQTDPPDAASNPPPPDAQQQRNCDADVSYGVVSLLGEFAFADGADYIQVDGLLNDAELPDAIQMQIYAGYSVFTDGIVTGTFVIDEVEAQYATCALCIFILADTNEAGEPTSVYLANGGTVTLTSVEGNLAGSLDSATFQHVNLAGSPTFESTPHEDGCTTGIDSWTFDIPLEEATRLAQRIPALKKK